MANKGAYIYQQIEYTTAEWATNQTIFPVSTLLFEKLENGETKIKMTDGVHTFAELSYVLNDAVLREEIRANLQASKDYTDEQIAAISKMEFKEVDVLPDEGDPLLIYLVPNANSTEVDNIKDEFIWLASQSKFEKIGTTKIDLSGYLTKEDAETLYVKKEIDKSLMSSEEKQRIADALVPYDKLSVDSLSDLPFTNYNISRIYTSSTPDAISFKTTDEQGKPISVRDGFECIISILNDTDTDIEQPLPNAEGWQSKKDSVTLVTGDVTEISIRYSNERFIVKI